MHLTLERLEAPAGRVRWGCWGGDILLETGGEELWDEEQPGADQEGDEVFAVKKD